MPRKKKVGLLDKVFSLGLVTDTYTIDSNAPSLIKSRRLGENEMEYSVSDEFQVLARLLEATRTIEFEWNFTSQNQNAQSLKIEYSATPLSEVPSLSESPIFALIEELSRQSRQVPAPAKKNQVMLQTTRKRSGKTQRQFPEGGQWYFRLEAEGDTWIEAFIHEVNFPDVVSIVNTENTEKTDKKDKFEDISRAFDSVEDIMLVLTLRDQRLARIDQQIIDREIKDKDTAEQLRDHINRLAERAIKRITSAK